LKLDPAELGAVTVVAPHAGAWIETELHVGGNDLPRSPPTRGRGLKLADPLAVAQMAGRPPRGGVD